MRLLEADPFNSLVPSGISETCVLTRIDHTLVDFQFIWFRHVGWIGNAHSTRF